MEMLYNPLFKITYKQKLLLLNNVLNNNKIKYKKPICEENLLANNSLFCLIKKDTQHKQYRRNIADKLQNIEIRLGATRKIKMINK